MLSYKAGTRVGKGTYWDLANGQRIDVEQEAILSGEESATYFRIPTGIMLIAGPVIGLLYVVCLPFIGIATVASLAAGKLVNGLLGLVGTSLSFEWRPKEAYLAGKKKGKKESK
jgi:VIT1/CCC1 family predicted Fe2+/Mn2+ transporter